MRCPALSRTTTGAVEAPQIRITHPFLYVRQSSLQQVHDHQVPGSTALKRRALALGWAADQVVVIDYGLGTSGRAYRLYSGSWPTSATVASADSSTRARRGELWIRPPLGFVVDPGGKLMLDRVDPAL